MTEKMFTSRSAVLSYKTCNYKRLLQYHLEGSGFVTERQSLDLLIGTVVHRGLQHLLEHCRLHKPDESLSEACIDEAVEKAYEIWRETIKNNSLYLYSGEEDRLDWIIAEQECLFEGLIRAFAIRKLPFLLDEYEILEVEHEEVTESFSSIVTFLGKADGLFLRKSDNKLVILSIKTTSQYAEVTERDILHDMQGVSEWFLVQERLDRLFKQYEIDILSGDYFKDPNYFDNPLNSYFAYCRSVNQTPKIFAVQYEYLIKGQRKEDPYKSGIYKQNSFLCHPLKMDNSMPQVQWGGAAIINPDEYKWKWGAGKYKKGWEKCDIWNEIGIKQWVSMLGMGNVQPEEGNPFDSILHTPDLVVRDEREIEEWLVSTQYQEEEIFRKLQEINKLQESLPTLQAVMPLKEGLITSTESYIQKLIWQYFSKNTMSCHNFYGKDCVFVRHCHEFSTIEELKDAGYLIPRVSHHQDEKLYQIEKGYIEDE